MINDKYYEYGSNGQITFGVLIFVFKSTPPPFNEKKP